MFCNYYFPKKEKEFLSSIFLLHFITLYFPFHQMVFISAKHSITFHYSHPPVPRHPQLRDYWGDRCCHRRYHCAIAFLPLHPPLQSPNKKRINKWNQRAIPRCWFTSHSEAAKYTHLYYHANSLNYNTFFGELCLAKGNKKKKK